MTLLRYYAIFVIISHSDRSVAADPARAESCAALDTAYGLLGPVHRTYVLGEKGAVFSHGPESNGEGRIAIIKALKIIGANKLSSSPKSVWTTLRIRRLLEAYGMLKNYEQFLWFPSNKQFVLLVTY